MSSEELKVNNEYKFAKLYYKENADSTMELLNGSSKKPVSIPFEKAGQSSELPEIPLAEKLKRKNEIEKIIAQYMTDFQAKLPKPHNCYVMGAMSIDVTTEPENRRKTKEAQKTLNAFLENAQNLTQEEYDKYFKELFGMTSEEYRAQKESNPEFKPNSPKIDKVKTINAVIENNSTYTDKAIKGQKQTISAKQKSTQAEIEKNYQNQLDHEGCITKGCNWFVEHCTWGTSKKDVLEALGKDKKEIQELEKIAKTGDDLAFAKKYSEITGVAFDIKNIEKAEIAQEEYIANQSINNLKEADEQLHYEERWNKNPNRISEENRYSLDFKPNYDKGGEEYSGLEKTLFNLYGGDYLTMDSEEGKKVQQVAKGWIENKTNELHLENKSPKERYEALVAEFHKDAKENIETTERELGYTIDEKSVKKAEKKAQEAQKAAYGSTMSEEKISKYTRNISITRAALDMGVLIASAGAGGAIAGVSTAARLGRAAATTAQGIKTINTAKTVGSLVGAGFGDFGKSLTERRTDNIESSVWEDLGGATKDGVIGAASFGIFAKTSKAVSVAFGKKFGEKAASNIVVRSLSDGAGGAVSGAFDGSVNAAIEGQNPIEAAWEGATGGGIMALTMPWGFKAAGTAFRPLKNLASRTVNRGTVETAKTSAIQPEGISITEKFNVEEGNRDFMITRKTNNDGNGTIRITSDRGYIEGTFSAEKPDTMRITDANINGKTLLKAENPVEVKPPEKTVEPKKAEEPPKTEIIKDEVKPKEQSIKKLLLMPEKGLWRYFKTCEPTRFDELDIIELRKVASPNNISFIEELANKVTKDGKPRFESYDIVEIVKIANAGNKNYIAELTELVTKDGKPRFNGIDISHIMEVANTGNKNYIAELTELVTKDGKPRFEGYDIKEIVKIANAGNKNYIAELTELVTKDGEPRFSGKDINYIAKVINDTKDLDYIKNLATITNSNGKPRFDGDTIAEIFKTTKTKNKSYIEELICMTDAEGKPKFKRKDIKIFAQLLNETDLRNIPFHSKTEIKERLGNSNNGMDNILDKIENIEIRKELQENLTSLIKSMDNAISPISVSQEANSKFWKDFLTTANKDNSEVIKGLDIVVEKYGKDGLPLEFSRADFVKELKAKLEALPEEQRAKILKKLDITLNGTSYEGFINPKGLNGKIAGEAEIQQLCNSFLLENRINTGDPQTDKFLNSVIKGMPELVNIIGKKQHGTHQYTLDCHTLKVLKEVVSNPKFETLSAQDKMIAQLMALFHDIGKQEGVVDTGHEFVSSIMANDILGKVSLPDFTKERIVELIKNHNWLQQIKEGNINSETAAVMFRNPEDAKIAEIFAEADLKGVGEDFYKSYASEIKPNIDKMRAALNNLYSTGNMLFPTRILNGDKFPTVEYNGQQYRVLDISKLPEDVDLTQFGLSVKDKKDLRLNFHTGDFETMQSLTKPFNEAIISTTMISPSKKSTFCDSKVGMMLDTQNSNVINSSPYNQESGVGRNSDAFVDMSKASNYHRSFQKEIFLNSLTKKYNVSESDYAEIYRHLIDKKHLSQVQDITLSNGTKIKADDLRSAYRAVEDAIMKNTADTHNEVDLYNPKVKGAILIGDSLSEIPAETLQFIREHNLPIFIMGKK